MNRGNEIGMMQQLVSTVETRVYGLRCRRRRRQPGGVYLQAPIIAQTCWSDLSSLDLTRGIR
jgi:hypothetical protein